MSKSISIFHASLGENARLARQAGDAAGDRYWTALVTEVDDMIWHAVEAGFGYFQREAGYTRTGSHNTRVHGRETGQWHEADLAVAHWLQHTSRDGDMQLHVHSQIAHIARTGTDGKWRAPDSLGYNEHVGAVAAIVSQHLEEALTRRFGVDWVARDDGHGFEIKGIGGEIMRVFSSRRVAITADLRARAARFEQRYGRKPSQRELAQLAQASNFKTRAAKEGALDFAELHQGWADKLARTLGVRLASVAPSVWHDGGDATARTRDPDGPGHTQLELVQAAQKAVALAQQEKSTWTRADLIKYLGRVLPRSGMDPETAAAREQRYRNLLMAHLPPGYRREPGHQVRWLWRTLRAAELAGLDAGGVLAAAIGERDLAGARDIPAVIDTRLRHRTGNLVPLPAGPWSAQIPAITDPERRAYAAEIAALMDARKDRIGEHAADHALPWAVNALGPVPAHPVDRLEWHRRASSLGAWRELSGYDHPADPIGPEPAAAAPDLRAAWHEALAALGPADGPDVRGMPDGTLLHLRDTYPLETAWAPQYVAAPVCFLPDGA